MDITSDQVAAMKDWARAFCAFRDHLFSCQECREMNEEGLCDAGAKLDMDKALKALAMLKLVEKL